jgi:hypothetical protein
MLPNREDTAMADITRLVSTGPSAQRVDIVFVAEGYQASERSKFLADVTIFSDYMRSASANISRLNDPFSAFADYFNVSALFVASAQSGTDQPSKGIYVDTYSAVRSMVPTVVSTTATRASWPRY